MLGDAHALDARRPMASLVLATLCRRVSLQAALRTEGEGDGEGEETKRETWAAAWDPASTAEMQRCAWDIVEKAVAQVLLADLALDY